MSHKGYWQHQVLRGLEARAAENIVLYKGMATSTGQYALVFLTGEALLPERFSSQRSLAGHSLQGRKESDTTETTLCA